MSDTLQRLRTASGWKIAYRKVTPNGGNLDTGPTSALRG